MWHSLLGVQGQITDLLTRLSSTWAAKLDTLESRLTAARAGYIDKLNIAGAVASTTDIAATSRADHPLLAPVMSGGIPSAVAPYITRYSGAFNAASSQTDSTTFVDAVNVSGKGVLELASHKVVTNAAAYTAYIEIIVDGITIFSGSAACNPTGDDKVSVPVGAMIEAYYGTAFAIAVGGIPFVTSLQIRHRCSTVGGTNRSVAYYKYRRTA